MENIKICHGKLARLEPALFTSLVSDCSELVKCAVCCGPHPPDFCDLNFLKAVARVIRMSKFT